MADALGRQIEEESKLLFDVAEFTASSLEMQQLQNNLHERLSNSKL